MRLECGVTANAQVDGYKEEGPLRVALAAAPPEHSREFLGPLGRGTSRQLVGGSWPDQSCLTVLQITKRPCADHPLVARGLTKRVSVTFSPQSGIIRNARLLRAQRVSQFIVGMLAPTSGDLLGNGVRDRGRALGDQSGPYFHIVLDLTQIKSWSLFCDTVSLPRDEHQNSRQTPRQTDLFCIRFMARKRAGCPLLAHSGHRLVRCTRPLLE